MESKTNMTRAVEMESAVKSLGTKRFAENATYLGTKVTSTGTTTDGTIFTSCVLLKMSYGFYQVTGVGPNEQTACTDCVIKTNALLGQQLGFAQTYRHSLPVDGEGNGDFLDDMKVVLDVARFSRKQTTNSLKLLQHFVAEDPTAAQFDASAKRLQEITKILGGLVSYECAPRNGVHVTKCLFLDYCSTGLGPSVKESKSHAASEMLYLLKQTVGLRIENRDGRPCLCLPAVDKLKTKTLKYFLMAPRECVSTERRLREIATVVDSALECHVLRSDGHVVCVEYSVNACRASVTGNDEPSCKRRCQTEMLLELHKWCGFNMVIGYETVEKCYKGLSENGPRPDERREETTRRSVELLEDTAGRRTVDGVKVLENDNVIVPNNDRERRNADSRPSRHVETESSSRLAKGLAESKRVSLSPFAKIFKKCESVSNPYDGGVISPFGNDSRRQAAAATTTPVRVQHVSPSERQCHDDLSRTERDNRILDVAQRRYPLNNTDRETFGNGQRYYENTHDPCERGRDERGQGQNFVQANYNVPSTLNRSDVHGQNTFNTTTSPHRVVESDHYGQRFYENTYDPSASEFHVQGQGQNYAQKGHYGSPTLARSDLHGQNTFNTTTSPYRVVESDHCGQRYYENTYDPSASGFHVQRQGENAIGTTTNPSYHVVENGFYTYSVRTTDSTSGVTCLNSYRA